jgi:peptidyl-prolyl cis-trans isomerase SurA
MITSLVAIEVDKIVAKVGRDIILKSELEQRKQQMKAANIDISKISDYEILNEMIDSKLIITQAKTEDFTVDELEIKDLADQQIKKIAANFPNEYEFKKSLKQEMGLTAPELKEYYIEMMTEQRLKEQIINTKIKSKVIITDAEIESYYQEHKEDIPQRPDMDKLGMIMKEVKASEETKNKALVKINDIRRQIENGADFEELAKKYSDCSSSANGGDLGYFGKGMMVKEFEEAAFDLMPGEVSGVVETMFGYHIIKVTDKKENEIRASHILIQVAPNDLDREATKILMNKILQELRDGADFSEMAAKYSDDKETALNGGIIGNFPLDQYPEMFKEYLSKLDYGEYTDVITEGDMLYILHKVEFVPAGSYEYTEIYDQLKQMVRNEKEMKLYDEWIKKLHNENYIEILLD